MITLPLTLTASGYPSIPAVTPVAPFKLTTLLPDSVYVNSIGATYTLESTLLTVIVVAVVTAL